MLIQTMFDRGRVFVDQIYGDDFIQGIIQGNLDPKVVHHYLKADAVYLNQFSDIYALLFSKTKDKTAKQFFLSQMDFILNQEVAAHKLLADYVKEDYDMLVADAAWYPTSDHYIKHMFYQIQEPSIAYPLAAMLPCPWIYREVARKIIRQHAIPASHPFKGWIDFYASDLMDECCAVYGDLIEATVRQGSDEDKAALLRVFLESCEHERRFFQMSVEQEDWPKEVRDV